MSTEFYCTEMVAEDYSDYDDHVYFVRYAGKASNEHGCAMEFGTVSNWENCRAMVVRQGRATFGEFPVTVAVGSATQWRMSEEA